MSSRIVVVGSPLEGLKGLQTLLWNLRADFPWPLVVVQHRRRDSELGLLAFLKEHSRLPLCEPEDKQTIVPGQAYLAPRNYHLLIEERSFALSTEPMVADARPSIDVLFESAADAFQQGVIALILDGTSEDGVSGLAKVRLRGGMAVLAHDDPGRPRAMPRAGIDIAEVDQVLPFGKVAPFLQKLAEPVLTHHVI